MLVMSKLVKQMIKNVTVLLSKLRLYNYLLFPKFWVFPNQNFHSHSPTVYILHFIELVSPNPYYYKEKDMQVGTVRASHWLWNSNWLIFRKILNFLIMILRHSNHQEHCCLYPNSVPLFFIIKAMGNLVSFINSVNKEGFLFEQLSLEVWTVKTSNILLSMY